MYCVYTCLQVWFALILFPYWWVKLSPELQFAGCVFSLHSPSQPHTSRILFYDFVPVHLFPHHKKGHTPSVRKVVLCSFFPICEGEYIWEFRFLSCDWPLDGSFWETVSTQRGIIYMFYLIILFVTSSLCTGIPFILDELVNSLFALVWVCFLTRIWKLWVIWRLTAWVVEVYFGLELFRKIFLSYPWKELGLLRHHTIATTVNMTRGYKETLFPLVYAFNCYCFSMLQYL